jgi:hypothetical protein
MLMKSGGLEIAIKEEGRQGIRRERRERAGDALCAAAHSLGSAVNGPVK